METSEAIERQNEVPLRSIHTPKAVLYKSADGTLIKIRAPDSAVAFDVAELLRVGRGGNNGGGGAADDDGDASLSSASSSVAAADAAQAAPLPVLHESASVAEASQTAMAAAMDGEGLDGGESYFVDAADGFTAEQIAVQRGIMTAEEAAAAKASEEAWATSDAIQQLRSDDGHLYW